MADTVKYCDFEAADGGDGSQATPYNRLAIWDANEAGAVGSGDRHILNFRSGAGADPGYLDLTGWSGAGELIIQRWGSANPVIRPGSGTGHAILAPAALFLRVLHIEIDMNLMDGNSEEGIRVQAGAQINACKIHGGSTTNMDGVYITGSTTANIDITNCQIYGLHRGAVFNQVGTGKTVLNIKNTVWNCGQTGASSYSVMGYEASRTLSPPSTMTCIGNAVHSPNGQCFMSATGGTYTANSDWNASSDGTAGTYFGVNSFSNVTFQAGAGGSGTRAMFLALGVNPDLHVFDDAANILLDNSAGPSNPTVGSLIPPFDYDGDPRSGLTADMGMDERSSGAVELNLDGAVGNEAGVAGAMVADYALTGELANQSALAGEILRDFELTGELANQAGVAGEMVADYALTGALANDAGVAGDMLADYALTGELANDAGVAGEMLADYALTGELANQAGMDGFFVTQVDVNGLLGVQSGLLGTVDAGIFLDGALDAQSGLLADTLNQLALSGEFRVDSGIIALNELEMILDGILGNQSGINDALIMEMLLHGNIDPLSSGLVGNRSEDFDVDIPKARTLCIENQNRILLVQHQDRTLLIGKEG